MTRVYERNKQYLLGDERWNLNLLGKTVFYPFDFRVAKQFFRKRNRHSKPITHNDTLTVHLWNSVTKAISIEEDSPLYLLITKICSEEDVHKRNQ